ncbi:SDR family oxidoreductase [Phytoactinopolyspora mesophila]|uniref:NAD(P)H-binding protein n=1 Tax=Phytoactinopolyspora mesophila TaxID=2650750 RepID=A0A7K3LXW3_9ACTN|nr:SDR family oxidoreductase [Phytoactinopolyspora mesophila]NDL55810.1 NAD(P)H-binding protein [Phytoactinopolyspora mesophila]
MITVTAATGQLGRLVVDALLDRGVPADRIVAAVRNPGKAADLAERGVHVREADYTKPETLTSAFAGTDKLLLISSSEVGQRLDQHTNVVKAAQVAGVSLIAYTSILNADTTGVGLAAEHKATEAVIRDSGLPNVFLRNGWYMENYTENLAPALEFGTLLGAASGGRISGATRADFAAAAASVLTSDGHAGMVYELGGDTPFTMAELAATVTAQSGKQVTYQDLSAVDYTKALVAAGLPEPVADMLADNDLAVARGELFIDSRDLSTLIGRPTTPLTDAVTEALRA